MRKDKKRQKHKKWKSHKIEVAGGAGLFYLAWKKVRHGATVAARGGAKLAGGVASILFLFGDDMCTDLSAGTIYPWLPREFEIVRNDLSVEALEEIMGYIGIEQLTEEEMYQIIDKWDNQKDCDKDGAEGSLTGER
ncbi:hypothetical protein [Anaerohalosphaera lusitana]|uniref:hypothetical protein n=1 Tax=Anaerohalosphaera lusitana TaxID=1936003 RepID=UPI001F2D0DCD|nr:hypothetical protein [Anaerohalosphaera lusitana]